MAGISGANTFTAVQVLKQLQCALVGGCAGRILMVQCEGRQRSAAAHHYTRLHRLAGHVVGTAAAAAPPHTNIPRGKQMQGFGCLSASQPPIFDTARCDGLGAAWAYFELHSFVVVKALRWKIESLPV